MKRDAVGRTSVVRRLSLTALFAAAALLASAEEIAWVYDDSRRVPETKSSEESDDKVGVELFGMMYGLSDEIIRFRTVPAYLKIIIR